MASLKKFSDSYLKMNGIDAHFIKRKIYKLDKIALYDIYDGDTVTIRDKKGKLIIDTELTKEEFFNQFGNINGGRQWNR